MIFWLLVASVLFGGVVHQLDRPSIPAWQAKYAYRAIAFICWIGWTVTALKALQWHTELITLIPHCH